MNTGNAMVSFMAGFFSILIFLIYKSAEFTLLYKFFLFFNTRYDLIIAGFYFILSIFQFLFIIFQSIAKNKSLSKSSSIFQYTTVITILMDYIIIGFVGYYLFRLENDLYNLIFIFAGLTPLHALFYYFHGISFSRMIKKQRVIIKSFSVIPISIFFILNFGIPIGFIIIKTFIRKGLSKLDIILLSSVLILNLLVIFIVFLSKMLKLKMIAAIIRSISVLTMGRKNNSR